MINGKTREFQESCLFVYGITSLFRIFHSYGDVIITGECLHILTYTQPIEQSGFFRVPHIL